MPTNKDEVVPFKFKMSPNKSVAFTLDYLYRDIFETKPNV